MPEDNRISVLLVERDIEVQNDFRDTFEDDENFQLVKITNGVKDAMEAFEKFSPDVVVTELALQQGEGCILISQIRKKERTLYKKKRTYIVVISRNTSDAALNMLYDNNADAVLSKNQDDFGAALVLNLLEVMKNYINCTLTSSSKIAELPQMVQTSAAKREQKLRTYIEQFIINPLGISTRTIGREYLVTAIMVGVNYDGKGAMMLTKDIYPEIMKKHKNNIANINRAINTVISNAWSKCDEETREKIYPAYVDPSRGQPTPSEFIAYFANELKRKGYGKI